MMERGQRMVPSADIPVRARHEPPPPPPPASGNLPAELRMSEGGRKGGNSRRVSISPEPGLEVSFRLKWNGGQKSFTTLDALRGWLRIELAGREALGRNRQNFSTYQIERIETYILERRNPDGSINQVYRPEEVDGAVPEG